MKYTSKLPSVNKELSKKLVNEGYKKIKEPKTITSSMVISIPIAIVLAIVTLLFAKFLNPQLFSSFQKDTFKLTLNINLKTFLYFIGVWVYMLIHELLHLILVPNFLRSKKTYWGINGLFGFVFTTEPIKKERFIAISIFPFVVLTVLVILITSLFGFLNMYILLLAVLNAAGSCVDFLNLLLVMRQVPSRAIIVSNGMETYYK